MKPIRLAVVCDYLEEGWPSMDLTAEMVLLHLAEHHAGTIEATAVRPAFRRRFDRRGEGRGIRFNLDRLANRYRDYPRALKRIAGEGRFDVYHVVDHSYAQLVHALPAGRCVVTCHDLDTFRCLLEPEAEPRPGWFRALTRRTLDGLRKAAAVSCDSDATRAAILRHGLVPDERLTTNHLGTHPECSPDPDPAADARLDALIGPKRGAEAVELLHVGSNIRRKRIDVLLKTFAGVLRTRPEARLIKVGGAFTDEQAALARELGVADRIAFLPYFAGLGPEERSLFAAVYRRADVLLQPSDAEGFGLPLAEAIACGTPIVASDIPVLREVGGDLAIYAPTGDVEAWVEATARALDSPRPAPGRSTRYRWSTHVEALVQIYRRVAGGPA